MPVVLEFGDAASAVCHLRSSLRRGDLVLLKASRASRFEELARALRAGGLEEEIEQ